MGTSDTAFVGGFGHCFDNGLTDGAMPSSAGGAAAGTSGSTGSAAGGAGAAGGAA